MYDVNYFGVNLYTPTYKSRPNDLGLTIIDKFMELNKIDFSMKCFTADCSQFLAQLPKFTFWMADYVLTINSKYFRDFLENSKFLKSSVARHFLRQLVHSLSDDNSLVPLRFL